MDMIEEEDRQELAWGIMQSKRYEVFKLCGALDIPIGANDLRIDDLYIFGLLESEIKAIKEREDGKQDNGNSRNSSAGQGFGRSKLNRKLAKAFK